MPYPINQHAHQFNSIQSVHVSFGLWDTALKFLSPGPCSDVTDHLECKLSHLNGGKLAVLNVVGSTITISKLINYITHHKSKKM